MSTEFKSYTAKD